MDPGFSQSFVNEVGDVRDMSLAPAVSALQPLPSDALSLLQPQSYGENNAVYDWALSSIPETSSSFPSLSQVSIQPNEFDNFVRQELRSKQKRDKRLFSTSSAISGYKSENSLEKVEHKVSKSRSEERSFICSISGCTKRFKTKSHLRRHEKSHDGLKPFSCSFPGCAAQFSRQDNMTQHLRMHSKKSRSVSSASPSTSSIHTLPAQRLTGLVPETLASPIRTSYFDPHIKTQHTNLQLHEIASQHPSPVSPLRHFDYSGYISPNYSSGDLANALSFSSPVPPPGQFSNVYLPTLENSPISPITHANVSPIVPLTLPIPNSFAHPDRFRSGFYDSPTDVYPPQFPLQPHQSFCNYPFSSMEYSAISGRCPEIKFNELEIQPPNTSNLDLFLCNQSISGFLSAPLSLLPLSQVSPPVMGCDSNSFPSCTMTIPHDHQHPFSNFDSNINRGTGSQLNGNMIRLF